MYGSFYIRAFQYFTGCDKQLFLLQSRANCLFTCSTENKLPFFPDLDLPDMHKFVQATRGSSGKQTLTKKKGIFSALKIIIFKTLTNDQQI